MYLSRLILDPRHPSVRRDLADRHDLHRTVMSAFPQSSGADGARRAFGILFRLESDRSGGPPRLYVQSQIPPDWERLPRGYLLAVPENPACRSVDEAYGRLSEGMVLSFVLTANATRKVGTSSKAERLQGRRCNGRRVFITPPEWQLEWLRRHAEAGGFELLSVRGEPSVADAWVTTDGRVLGHRGSQVGSEHVVTFGSVTFRGHLRITDSSAFRRTLAEGLGSGKAYGFGMLCLAPP